MTPGKWIGLGIISAVLTIVVATVIIVTPSWERANAAKIALLQEEGERLHSNGKPKEAWYKFNELFDFVGDRRIKDEYIKDRLESARELMQQSWKKAQPIIEREQAEERERMARAEGAERSRIAREKRGREQREQQRRAQEQAREEANRQQREAEQKQISEALAREALKNSPQVKALRNEADRIVNQLRLDLITEDSAYGSMSRRARATRDLLAIFIKLQGLYAGTDVTTKVDQVIVSAERDTLLEDSAIRAIYTQDSAILQMLGIWCDLLAKADSSLPKKYADKYSDALRGTIIDDSAPRAISRYSGANMNILADVVAAKGKAVEAKRILSDTGRRNVAETSAWRESMCYAQGNMELLLALFDGTAAATAKRIRARVDEKVINDDSAFRAQSQYRQGAVDALHVLIRLE